MRHMHNINATEGITIEDIDIIDTARASNHSDEWSDLSIHSEVEDPSEIESAEPDALTNGGNGVPWRRDGTIFVPKLPRGDLVVPAASDDCDSSDKPGPIWKGSNAIQKRLEKASRLLGARQSTANGGRLVENGVEQDARAWSPQGRRSTREFAVEPGSLQAMRRPSLGTFGTETEAALDLFECFSEQRRSPINRKSGSSFFETTEGDQSREVQVDRELTGMDLPMLPFPSAQSGLAPMKTSCAAAVPAMATGLDAKGEQVILVSGNQTDETKEMTSLNLSEAEQLGQADCGTLEDTVPTVACSSGPNLVDLLHVDRMLRSKLKRNVKRPSRSGDRCRRPNIIPQAVDREHPGFRQQRLASLPFAGNLTRFYSHGHTHRRLPSSGSATCSTRCVRRFSSLDARQPDSSPVSESFLKRSVSRKSDKLRSPSRRLSYGRTSHQPWNSSNRDVVFKLRRAVPVIRPGSPTVGCPLESIVEVDQQEAEQTGTTRSRQSSKGNSGVLMSSVISTQSEWLNTDCANSADGSIEEEKKFADASAGDKKTNRFAPFAGFFQLRKAGRSRADGTQTRESDKAHRTRAVDGEARQGEQTILSIDELAGETTGGESPISSSMVSDQGIPSDLATNTGISPIQKAVSLEIPPVVISTEPPLQALAPPTGASTAVECSQTSIGSQSCSAPNVEGLTDIPLTNYPVLDGASTSESNATPASTYWHGVGPGYEGGSVEFDFVPLRSSHWIQSSAPCRNPTPLSDFASQSSERGGRSLLANVQSFFGLNLRERLGSHSTGYWRRRRRKDEPSTLLFDDQLLLQLDGRKLPSFPVLPLAKLSSKLSGSIKLTPTSLDQGAADPWAESAGSIASARRPVISKQLTLSHSDQSPEGHLELFTPPAMNERMANGSIESSSPVAGELNASVGQDVQTSTDAQSTTQTTVPLPVLVLEKSAISTGFLRLFTRRKRDVSSKVVKQEFQHGHVEQSEVSNR